MLQSQSRPSARKAWSHVLVLTSQKPVRPVTELDDPSRLLDLDDAFRRRGFDLLYPFHYPAGKIEQCLGMRRVLAFKHRGLAFISGFANLWVELNAAEEIDAELA